MQKIKTVKCTVSRSAVRHNGDDSGRKFDISSPKVFSVREKSPHFGGDAPDLQNTHAEMDESVSNTLSTLQVG